TGPLLGTTSIDIGSAAGNVVVTYTYLEIYAVGNGKQLIASSSGFVNATSSVFSVSGGAFSKVLVIVPGETFAPGSATGKTGTPTAQTAGTAFTVTVNAVDDNFNLQNTVSDTAGITSSDANAVLPANVALVSGT